MSSKYKFLDNSQPYFVTFSVVEWIDLFIRNEYKEILLKSFRHCVIQKGMELYGWCIMTSHVHLIIGTKKEPLSNIMRDMKKHTSQALRKAIQVHPGESRKAWILDIMKKEGRENSNNQGFQLWRQDNHPVELNHIKIIYQKLDYLHNNPVEACFVQKQEDWLYSSARNYHGLPGLIEVTLFDPERENCR